LVRGHSQSRAAPKDGAALEARIRDRDRAVRALPAAFDKLKAFVCERCAAFPWV
jgi:hypothetical protein